MIETYRTNKTTDAQMGNGVIIGIAIDVRIYKIRVGSPTISHGTETSKLLALNTLFSLSRVNVFPQ